MVNHSGIWMSERGTKVSHRHHQHLHRRVVVVVVVVVVVLTGERRQERGEG